VGYEFDWNQRDFTEAEITREHTGKVKLSSSPIDMASGWVEYAYSDREGSHYDPNRPFTSNVTDAYIAATPGCHTPPAFAGCRDNDFFNRKIYLADREQDKVTGSLTFIPVEQITLGLTGIYTNQDFNDTGTGTTGIDIYSATLDVSYMPRENIDTYAYYTYEFFDRELAGRDDPQFSGPPLIVDYLYDTEDRVNTVGAGIKWSKIREKFDVTADYTFSMAETEIDPININPSVATTPFPELETTIHSINLRGDYHLKDNLIVRFNYLFEYFNSTNWALDGFGQAIAGATNIVALGNRSPDYNVHVFGISFVYDF
jgi:MtrB/PioB family decaheme-associated outer membrane protein